MYDVEARARGAGLTPGERLKLHQVECGPPMAELEEWFRSQIEEKVVEPNSGLGKAIRYMRKSRDPSARGAVGRLPRWW